MKDATAMRQAMAELNWGRNPSALLWIGNRAVHQYWALLAPYFRDVLLVPQRRAEDQIIAWSWRENGESRQPTGTELAALRKRLAGDWQAFADNAHDGADETRGGGNAKNQPGIAQIAVAMEGWVSRLLAMPDSEFAGFVACTEAGLRLHSWGLTTAAVPFYPDDRKSAAERAAGNPDEPSVEAETSAAPVARGRRKIGWVFLAVMLLAGGLLWIGRRVWLSADDARQTADAAGTRREAGGFNLSKQRQASGGADNSSGGFGSAHALEKRTTAGSGAVAGPSSGVGPDAAASVKTPRKSEATEAAGQNTGAASIGGPLESQGGDQRLFVGGAGTASASDSTAGGAPASARHGVATGGVSAAPSGGGAAAAVSTAMPANLPETSLGGASKLASVQTATSGASPAPMGVRDRVSANAEDALAPRQKSAAAPERTTEENKIDAKSASAEVNATVGDGEGAVQSRAPERADEASDAEQIRENERANAAGVALLPAIRETSNQTVASADMPWARVVRVQAAVWRVRLLGETILPTQPMRAGAVSTLEVMRAQALAERRVQLPAAFAAIRGRRGFTVESEAGPLRWQVAAGVETVSLRANENRAEISWPESEPPASGIYEAVDAQGRTVARLEVDADQVPVLALARGSRGWFRLELDGEVAAFTGRRLAEETMPPGWLWTTDAHGARLEIPLTTPLGTTEIETVAMLDPATGWAVVSPITLAATSAPP
jgi:hypothetical protein